MRKETSRVMVVYWGRRGALTRFTLEFGLAARADPSVAATISVSRQNESFADYAVFGKSLFPVSTFDSSPGAVLKAWRIVELRRRMEERLRQDGIQTIIELMPHIWSPLVMPLARRDGIRYVPIIHDVHGHLGDPTGIVNGWLNRVVQSADVVLTLSNAVADRIVATGLAPERKVFPLFHPDLTYGVAPHDPLPTLHRPIRLLFLGRILAYKGLGLFLDTIEQLRSEGIEVAAGVFGEGDVSQHRDRLTALQAEVVNRWLTEAEIAEALAKYDVVVLSHLAASQSGIAATAFGAGRPVVATPVGGLLEQVQHGISGLVAKRIDACALAEEIKALVLETGLYAQIVQSLHYTARERSMARFVRDCVSHATHIVVPR